LLFNRCVFYFLAIALYKTWQSYRKRAFYFRILKNITKENLVSKREQIKQDMSKNKSCGALWKEFDQTLVYSTKETKLFNTLDADYFFNTSTLANGISNSRMMAAVPSFLTAIGVLGTFTGLQLGIGGLDLDTQDTEILKHGIASVVHGASIAFTTSVWGVFLSLLFNFIEKLLEAGLQYGITNLQEKIDHLFPRINAEQSLIDISNSNKSSEEVLMGLAEKIGDTMQKAVSDMGEHPGGHETKYERSHGAWYWNSGNSGGEFRGGIPGTPYLIIRQQPLALVSEASIFYPTVVQVCQ